MKRDIVFRILKKWCLAYENGIILKMSFDFLTNFLYYIIMIVTDDFLEMYVLMCSTISKPVRLKIIHTIGQGKMNVSTLQKKINVPMSNLSNHLTHLYRAGILGKEKDGNFVFYYLTEPKLLKGISQMQEIIKNITQRRSPTIL